MCLWKIIIIVLQNYFLFTKLFSSLVFDTVSEKLFSQLDYLLSQQILYKT